MIDHLNKVNQINKHNLHKSNIQSHQITNNQTFHQNQNQCSGRVQKYHKPEVTQKVVTICEPIAKEPVKVVEKKKTIYKPVPYPQKIEQFVPNYYDLTLPEQQQCEIIEQVSKSDVVIEEYKERQQRQCQKIKALKQIGLQHADLEKRNEYLKNEIEKIKMEQIDKNAVSLDDNSNLNQQIMALQAEIKTMNERVQELNQSIFKLDDLNSRLRWEIQNDVPDKIKYYTNKRTDYQLKLGSTQSEVERLYDENQEVKLEISQQKNYLKSKEKEIERKEEIMNDLNKQIEELKEKMEDYLRLKQIELLNRELEKKTIKMDGTLINQNTELAELRDQLNQFSGLPQILDGAIKERDQLSSRLQEMEIQSNLKKDNDQVELDELKRVSQERSHEIERLREQLMRSRQPQIQPYC